ncbi:BZ3500_MvSof-1268-A1-R1_Chr2-1g04150 [Microbotryum saponariae]|uniref:BZ3500_MvSof-1268-A1-R1_Chr2-1g04150 protein n=1 Tax=Microbotryum saponariae TaxID=289078 RepID=A0A2X0KFA2_9BASI|nr:BZ3500_MvSof-1268-A1-R1_Chr2-1g04150 [Microbotryum saponariae]SCZ91137.1 BZ3501_MvSof-1269-A2-R1_Chr2-1g03806 [Microbotryum saponariae]
MARDSLLPEADCDVLFCVSSTSYGSSFNHPVLPLPKSHLQAFPSRLLYNNLHEEQRGSRAATVGNQPRTIAEAQRQRRRAKWIVKSICTGSRQSQCRPASATGPQSFTCGLEIRSSTL